MSAHGKLSELQVGAYRLSPAVWADRELKPRLGLDLDQWQRKLVSAPRGSRQCLLTYRQSGKSTAAAVAASHSMIFRPGSTSLAIAPSQRQSAEVARRARAIQDHSALVLGGAWPQAQNAIGIVQISRFPLGTPLLEVAEQAAAMSRGSNARVVCDLSNNSGFATLLGPLLGERPANRLLCAVITGAGTHAAQPMPMPITVAGKTVGVPRITCQSGS